MKLDRKIVRTEWVVTYKPPKSESHHWHHEWARYDTKSEALLVAEQLNSCQDVQSVRVAEHECIYTIRSTEHDVRLEEKQLP